MKQKTARKLRCAVIGVGKMGKHHVRVYSEIKDVELVGVADLNEELGKETALKYRTKYYRKFEDLLDIEKPDIVSICVPTSFHYQVGKICIERHVNILLEKPISTTVSEGQKLLALAKKNNIKILVGHIERHNPAVKKLKELLDKKKLGKVTSIIVRRVGGFPSQNRDANIMVDLAIHDIDIVNFLLEELPREININKTRVHTETREDAVEFFLKYKTCSVYIQTNWFTPVKIRKINITGSEGYVELDYITQQIVFFKSNYEKFRETVKGFSDYILRFSEPDLKEIPVIVKEPLKEELLYFIECVKTNKKVDSQFALDALKVALSRK